MASSVPNLPIYDPNGKPVQWDPTKAIQAHFIRNLFVDGRFIPPGMEIVHGMKEEEFYQNDRVRAQVPWLVTLSHYDSKLMLTPRNLEIFVYAPPELTKSVLLAHKFWKRWFRTPFLLPGWEFLDPADDYPKIEDVAVAEPIDDEFYDECWKFASARKNHAAGDPRDPFAFTCLEGDMKVYRTEDPGKGLIIPNVKIPDHGR